MRDVARFVRERGLVVLPQVTASEFLETMSQLGSLYHHPDSDRAGRTLIRPSGRRGEPGLGFTMQAVPIHTDRSSFADPPRFLGMHLIRHDASMGGVPLFADLGIVEAHFSPEALASLSIEAAVDGSRLPIRLDSCGFRYRDDTHRYLTGPRDLVAEMRRLTDQATQIAEGLHSGDAYIIDNHRIAHGRTAITSPDRTAVRVLAYSSEQTGMMLP